MRIVNSKNVDSFKIMNTVEELIAIKNEFTSGKYISKKDFLKRRRRFFKAHQDLFILNWQKKRQLARAKKTEKTGFWAQPADYYYIPKAIQYEQLPA